VIGAVRHFALLAQSAAYEAAEPAARLTSYRLGRVEEFDDPRLFWSGLALFAVVATAFVLWLYRRESVALPRGGAAVLAALRLTALAGAMLFFLTPLKRTDQEVVTESRVAVLVDSSQSMAVEDESAGDERTTRSEAAVGGLVQSNLIDELRKQHDVAVAGFNSDVHRVRQYKRHKAATAGRAPDRDQRSRLYGELKPLGTETRLGDALAAVLADRAGGPLAAVYVLSDGGQNRGVDPLAVADSYADAKTPVVTIGLGSTDPRRNVRLQELIAPARAYPDDTTVVRALVHAEGYAGRTVDVELYAREVGSGEAAAVRIDRKPIALEGDPATGQAEFEIEPSAVGRLELEARLVAPPDDQYAEDNERTADVEVVQTSLRVLLLASGATRDYRFLRNQLRRDRHVTVDVLLQLSPPGISQDADAILTDFPTTKEDLFKYDAIVAFDPDWTQLTPDEVDLLEQWVAEEAGGLLVTAGPVHTSAWIQSPDHGKIRALYPVEFQRRLTLMDDGLFGSKAPWPIEFTRSGEEADFLWLGATPQESRDNWARFPGVFGCYAVKGPKPGAQVYGRYSDPEAGLSVERPVYMADHFYGAGRVFYLGSGELWRLRGVDPGLFERLYTQLVRHVSEGRLLRGSSYGRLLVERDRYFVGDAVVVRAQLTTASREPYQAESVTARVTLPGRGGTQNVDLTADQNRPGNFMGQFTVPTEGSYRIELAPPDAPGEPLTKRIAVAAPDLEFHETRRNEALLVALADRTGGKYYASPRQAIDGTTDLKPAASLVESREETKVLRGKPDEKFAERVNKWLLGVICGALCVEWLLRRLMKLA
jgi:hypothetical protein